MLLRSLRRGFPPQGFRGVLILVVVAGALVGARLVNGPSPRGDLFYPSGGDAAAPGPGSSVVADVPSADTQATVGTATTDDPAGATAVVAPSTSPMRVVIPPIGVSSGLVRLGLNPDRTVQVPSSFSTAGWYTGSAVPGDPGKPAVILGHVDSRSGPAIFYRLKSMQPGDDVWIQRSDGSWIRFTVDRVAEYPKAHFPTRLVYGPQPGVTLRLVTCGGDFDYSTGHYVDNIVVFATLA